MSLGGSISYQMLTLHMNCQKHAKCMVNPIIEFRRGGFLLSFSELCITKFLVS